MSDSTETVELVEFDATRIDTPITFLITEATGDPLDDLITE